MNWYKKISQANKGMSPKDSFIQMIKELRLGSIEHPFYVMGVGTASGEVHHVNLELHITTNGWRLAYIGVPEESRQKV